MKVGATIKLEYINKCFHIVVCGNCFVYTSCVKNHQVLFFTLATNHVLPVINRKYFLKH